MLKDYVAFVRFAGMGLGLGLALADGGCAATSGGAVVAGSADGGATKDEDAGADAPRKSATPTDALPEPAAADYQALFARVPSIVATPNSLNGLWEGTVGGQPMRLRFEPTAVTVILKCSASAPPIGMAVPAVVSSLSIRTLESKTLGDPSTCGLALAPDEMPNCGVSRSPCFSLKGLKLEFNGLLLTSKVSRQSSSFAKVSD